MDYGKKGVRRKKKLLNSATKKIGTKAGVTAFKILLICVVTFIVGGSCVVLGMIKGIIDTAPEITTIDVSPSGYATKVYDAGGGEVQSLVASGSNRVAKNIDEMPLILQHAFVAIEDERFYEHNGIDIKGIFRAASIAVTSLDFSEGASTITQQLLKNNVFNAYNESTAEKFKRKIQEQYLAIKLETYMDKDMILQNYLNSINLGNGYLGVEAAANGYFNKDVSELTISECAVIASITQNPSGYNPVKHPEDNKKRQEKVLTNMLTQGYITQAQFDEAIADDVYARIQDIHTDADTSTYSYFTDELINQLTDDLVSQKGYTEAQASNLIYKGGLSVYSTQDSTMQGIADGVINDPSRYPASTQFSISYALSVKNAEGKITNYSQQTLQKYFQTTGGQAGFKLTYTNEDKANADIDQYKAAIIGEGDTIVGETKSFTVEPQISFTLMDQHTGYVKVIIGGRGEKTGSRTLNRATDTARQPGSAMKPIAVYGPALDTNAITLASPIDDAPYYYTGTQAQLVNDYDTQYLGLTTVRNAIAWSRNVPAVKVLTSITPQVGFNYALKFGLSTLVAPKNSINGSNDVVQSLALGGITKGVTNIDMTAAYAAVANNGTYTKPIYYTKVYDHDGNLILDNSVAETHEVLKETTAFLLTSAMESVVTDANGTGKAAKISNQPVAGKSGTTNVSGDKWFCAYTPYYTASVWIGYDDNTILPSTAEFNHVAIWQAIMSQIHADIPTGTFVQPKGIVQLQVCSQSGKLPVPGLCDSDQRGSQIITEYFSEDNQPTETCDVHQRITKCNVSGQIATPYCTSTTTEVIIKKAAPNVLNPSDTTTYKVNDADYARTDVFLSTLCSIHNKASTTVTPTTPAVTQPATTATTAATTKATTAAATTAATKNSNN